MSEIGRLALFGKLNAIAYKSIETATTLCKQKGNPYVELSHWVQQILQAPDSDMHRIVRHFQLEGARLATDVSDAIERLPRGSAFIQDLSPDVEDAG